jgi:hypothetical protein
METHFIMKSSWQNTLSSPKDGLLVTWEREIRSEYIDLEPLFVDGLIPALTEAIELSLPSESYLFTKTSVRKHGHNSQGQKRGGNSLLAVTYQDLNFFASGISGFTSTVLLPIVDKDTPKTAYKEYITHGNSIQRAHFKWEPMFLSVTYLESPQL